MIAPHRGQRRTPSQDGRPLRRYRKRWRVESAFRLASSFSTTRDPLGVSRRQLLWDGSPWVHENPFPLSVTLAKEATAGEYDSAEMVSRTSCEGAEW
jgi:hypothetical protein